jgi:hypothetical protein
VANEVLFLRVRFWTVVASKTRLAARVSVVISDMRFELSFFCGPFPSTEIRVMWALIRFCVCLQVPSKILLASRMRTNMSRSNKPQLACGILFVSLRAVRPSATGLFVYNRSSAIGCFDSGFQGTIRSERALRGCILGGRI